MKSLIIPFIILMSHTLHAQKEFINTYTRISTVSGGMEDGGKNTTTSYKFVTKKQITLQNIFKDSLNVILQKGDSIWFNLITYDPYQIQSEIELKENPKGNQYQLVEFNGRYIVNLYNQKDLSNALVYLFKKKQLVAECKEEIDRVDIGIAH